MPYLSEFRCRRHFVAFLGMILYYFQSGTDLLSGSADVLGMHLNSRSIYTDTVPNLFTYRPMIKWKVNSLHGEFLLPNPFFLKKMFKKYHNIHLMFQKELICHIALSVSFAVSPAVYICPYPFIKLILIILWPLGLLGL